MKIKHNSINYSVNTVDDLTSLIGEDGDTVVVSDIDRGGTFIYDSTKTAENNGGTVFNGWVRQYGGAVNVKWFIQCVDASSDIGIQRAFNYSVANAESLVIPAEEFVIKNTLNFSCEAESFEILCDGWIVIDSDLSYGVKLLNGVNISGNLKFKGAGSYAFNGGAYTYGKDKASNISGLTTALLIRSVTGCSLDLTVYNFDGRGLEILEKEATEIIKTDAMNLGKLNFKQVGQSMYILTGSGLGSIGDIWSNQEKDGAYISSTDLYIGRYENSMQGINQGVVIENSTTVHINSLSIGGGIVGGDHALMSIKNCNYIDADFIYLFSSSIDGILIEDCYDINVSIQTKDSVGYGVVIDGLRDSRLSLLSFNDNDGMNIKSNTNEINRNDFTVKIKDAVSNGINLIKGGYQFTNSIFRGSAVAAGDGVYTASSDIDVKFINFKSNLNIPVDNSIAVSSKLSLYNNEPSTNGFLSQATAWVSFDGNSDIGTDCAITASYNVSRVAHSDDGSYSIYFKNKMLSQAYICIPMGMSNSGGDMGYATYAMPADTNDNNSLDVCNIETRRVSDPTVMIDTEHGYVVFFGGR